MNFYTLIFNKESMSKKSWLRSLLLTLLGMVTFIFGLNVVVDPYNVTEHNILGLKYKFVSDDRADKLNHFKTLPSFDNILIGSSRVYSIKPQTVSKILGGSTYNFGVGTATVEDHLGILKYLIRENKIPKNIIIGVDFYTFNKEVPPTNSFLKNKELNFLSFNNYNEDKFSKLFSFDSLKASMKTLKFNYFKKTKPHFDRQGWAGEYKSQRDGEKELLEVKKEADVDSGLFYSNFHYMQIDQKRVKYYEEIRELAKQHGINLYIFSTPLHPYLLNLLQSHATTKKALNEFLEYFATYKLFTNLYNNKMIYKDIRHFHGATHTTAKCGDLILKEVLLF